MRYFDRVKETTTTTGTGDIALAGAATGGFVTFSSVYSTNDRVPYAIISSDGSEREIGWGTLTGSTTLQRTEIYSSTNGGAAVNFSAGTKEVFVTIPGLFMSRIETMGHALAKSRGCDMP